MSDKRGLFITIEGGEGVGKSTNIAYIADAFKQLNIPFILTREPGGTPLAEDIRALLLSTRDEMVSEDTELLLMFAARAQHIAEVIEPALQKNICVICDRFTDATYAYQGGARGLGMEKVADLEKWVQGDLRPDYTLLLDAPVDVGMSRAAQRGELDRFESEKKQFFESVRESYLYLAKKHPDRYRVVDASKSLDAVQEQVTKIIEEITSRYLEGNQ